MFNVYKKLPRDNLNVLKPFSQTVR